MERFEGPISMIPSVEPIEHVVVNEKVYNDLGKDFAKGWDGVIPPKFAIRVDRR